MAIDALSEVHLTVPLAISSGGTGQASASAARTALGLQIGTDVQAQNALLQAIGSLTSAADKGIQFTGVGTVGTFDLTSAGRAIVGASNAADQRTVLGLGSIAIQSTSSVSITGGSITGITDVAIADGGTGASTAADARANLGTPYLRARRVYTSSATWSKPAGLSQINVEIWGGGGGAQGATGAGGNGGNSSFGSHCSATGGGGGQSGPYGGGPGNGSGGDLNFRGQRGGTTSISQLSTSPGGCAPRGGGGGGIVSNNVGEVGGFPGGGAAAGAASRSAGGGSGYSMKLIDAASLGSTESVTVGAAGAAGSGGGGYAGGAGLVIVEEWGY